MDMPAIIAVLAALGAFVSVVAVGMPLVRRDPFVSRLKAVAAHRQELSAKQKASLQQKSRFQPKRHVSLMKSILEHLRLQNLIEGKDLRLRLSQAGFRRQSAAISFIFIRFATPVVCIAAALVWLTVVPGYAQKELPFKLIMCVAAAGFGFVLPNILLSNTIQKRQQVLGRAFPDALDLMLICVEAGLSIEAAFSRVTDEMVASCPAMAEEIGLTAAELAFLGDRRQAYENFAERTGLPTVKSLSTALVQAEKYGTSVSTSLRVISQENRDNRMSAAEKKAAALPAQLTVPMIIFFLPVLFVVIIGPAAIQVSRTLGN